MNLSSIIDRAAINFADKTALVSDRRRFTYGRLKSAIERVAFYLSEHGIGRGDRVAIFMPNRPEWVAAYYGIIRLGAVAVCASSAYKHKELAHLFNDCPVSAMITSDALLPQVPQQEAVPSLKDVVVWENDRHLASVFDSRSALNKPFRPVDCDVNDECAILFTGGTTGTPKGAMLTHCNILYSAQNVCYHERAVPEDVALCFLPLNHVFGGVHIMNSTLYGCGTLVLHKSFDMDRLLSSVQSEKITRLYSVPTVYIRLLGTPDSRKYLTSVNYCFSAATSMASEIVRRWQEKFNLIIHEAYGMTETSSLVTFNHLYRHRVGSVGTPAGVVEIKIVDKEDNELPPGESGEIIIRGPNIMKGYFNKAEETGKVLHNGWLHSGDIGRLDKDGYLYIVDRIKDLIISGGLNVYPTEVEEILYTHPAVEECAVIGMPHPEYGEAVSAFVKRKQGRECSEKDLIDYCKKHIASYKAPKKILFVEELPKSPAGKILKREIRKAFTGE
ncbi:MAG: long-chain-fatty-acid--CoA ligase [Deltaproteobacteria bacterium]|nr:long-chain-fatty-acid--CoA ligase [Deltaproteobacteria bacterium]